MVFFLTFQTTHSQTKDRNTRTRERVLLWTALRDFLGIFQSICIIVFKQLYEIIEQFLVRGSMCLLKSKDELLCQRILSLAPLALLGTSVNLPVTQSPPSCEGAGDNRTCCPGWSVLNGLQHREQCLAHRKAMEGLMGNAQRSIDFLLFSLWVTSFPDS